MCGMKTAELPTTHWKAVLAYQGRTIRWLAAATGVSYSAATKYSNGQLTPTRAWLERASHALGVRVTG